MDLRPAAAGRLRAAVGVAALLFGVYGIFMAGSFAAGYEPGYSGVAEGIIRTGVPQLMTDSPLYGGPANPAGRVYLGPTTGWAGPVGAIPLVAAGMTLDKIVRWTTGHGSDTFLVLAAQLYAPLLTALTGALVFVAAWLLFGSTRRSVLLALAYGLTTIAFPYTKIGMEPPLAFWTMAAFTAAILARRFPQSLWWPVLCGTCAGFAAATRTPAAAVLILPVLVCAAWQRDAPRFALRLGVLVVPFVVGNLLSVGYDKLRCGKVLCETEDFGRFHTPPYQSILGMLFSPGKSVFVTSPILVLAVIGAVLAWREGFRAVAAGVTGLATVAVALLMRLDFWSDELFGTRYLVFLVAPAVVLVGFALGWAPGSSVSAASRIRRARALVVLAAVGLVIQLTAVIPQKAEAPCAYVVKPLFTPGRMDQNLCRFVPQFADVPLNFRLTWAMLRQDLGGGKTVIRYTPTGIPASVHYRTRTLRLDVGRPNLAVFDTPRPRRIAIFLVLLAVAVAGAFMLAPWLGSIRPRRPESLVR